MIPTPARLAQLLTRRTPPDPKPPGAPPVPLDRAPIRVHTPPPATEALDRLRDLCGDPPDTHYARAYTPDQRTHDARALGRLAELTHDLNDPWAAALGMDWEAE